jgi:hypothetical protein
MVPTDDYSPIIEEGSLEKPRGIVERALRRRALPAVATGQTLVLRNDKGAIVKDAELRSAGERYWGSPLSWVKVDTGTYQLDFSHEAGIPAFLAKFVVRTSVSVKVADAAKAVEMNVRSVRGFLDRLIDEEVKAAAHDQELDLADDDGSSHQHHRMKTEKSMSAHLKAASFGDDGWLLCRVTNVRVVFDESSSDFDRRVDDVNRERKLRMLNERNEMETADFKAKMRRKETETTIEIGNMNARGEIDRARLKSELTKLETVSAIDREEAWAAFFGKYLSDSVGRAVVTACSDPTTANVSAVVGMLESGKRKDREQAIEVLRVLSKGDFPLDDEYVNMSRKLLEALTSTLDVRTPVSGPTQAAVGSGEGDATEAEQE